MGEPTPLLLFLVFILVAAGAVYYKHRRKLQLNHRTRTDIGPRATTGSIA
jgi:hypothetical protein